MAVDTPLRPLGGPSSRATKALKALYQHERSGAKQYIICGYLRYQSFLDDRMTLAVQEGRMDPLMRRNMLDRLSDDPHVWKIKSIAQKVEKRLRYKAYMLVRGQAYDARSNVLSMMLSGKWPRAITPELLKILYENLAECVIERFETRTIRLDYGNEISVAATNLLNPSRQSSEDCALMLKRIQEHVFTRASIDMPFIINGYVWNGKINFDMTVLHMNLAARIQSMDLLLQIVEPSAHNMDHRRHLGGRWYPEDLFAYHGCLAAVCYHMPALQHLTLTIDDSGREDDGFDPVFAIMNRSMTADITRREYMDNLIGLLRRLGALDRVPSKYYRFAVVPVDGVYQRTAEDPSNFSDVRRDMVISTDGVWAKLYPTHLDKMELEAHCKSRYKARKEAWVGSVAQQYLSQMT